jgi:hypothetical protein
MKKLSALMLGAAMVLSTAAFAAAKPENKPATSTTTKKVHQKKVKTSKTSKKSAAAATPATPAPTK